jgi:hypothetical protein
MLRLPVAGALAVLSLALVPVAQGATVTLEGDVLVFHGTGDEKNSVNVRGFYHEEYGRMLELSDTDADITAYPEDLCLPGDYFVRCLYSVEDGFRVEAGGGDDFVRVNAAFNDAELIGEIPGTVLGGPGADRLDDETSTYSPVTALRRFVGGPGNDEITAWEGPDVVLGGDGDDVIDGGAGNDEVRGGAGDDTVRGDRYAAPGADIVDGGEGNDLGDEWNDPAASTNPAVTITQDGLAGDGRPGENDNVTSIERFSSGMHGTIEGTAAADDFVIYGQYGGNVIRGLAGDDKIQTGSQKDDIDGGTGADSITAGFGDDQVTGGPGADTILADGGSVYCGYYTCEVPYGNDMVLARDGEIDSVDCGPGQDSVQADANDVVAANCETVDRPGGSTPGATAPTPAPGSPGSPGAVAAAPSVKFGRGFSFTVTCADACKVTAQLRYKGKLVGSARRTGSGKVTVKLSKAGKRRLRRMRRAKLALRVTVGSAKFSKTVSYRR